MLNAADFWMIYLAMLYEHLKLLRHLTHRRGSPSKDGRNAHVASRLFVLVPSSVRVTSLRRAQLRGTFSFRKTKWPPPPKKKLQMFHVTSMAIIWTSPNPNIICATWSGIGPRASGIVRMRDVLYSWAENIGFSIKIPLRHVCCFPQLRCKQCRLFVCFVLLVFF
jgi:hypothetical protein